MIHDQASAETFSRSSLDSAFVDVKSKQSSEDYLLYLPLNIFLRLFCQISAWRVPLWPLHGKIYQFAGLLISKLCLLVDWSKAKVC